MTLEWQILVMPNQLTLFPSGEKSSLRVFCPNMKDVVTSFESYLPASVAEAPGVSPNLPARLSWIKEGMDYHAYLPKERPFQSHLLEPLKRQTRDYVQKDGRWFLDEDTRILWASLDDKLTASIEVVSGGMLVELGHVEPESPVRFGFTRGHKTQRGASISSEKSRKGFVHRLAYLVYLVSMRYKWGENLVDQLWWKALLARCGPVWVDSVWDAVYRQWKERNFVGVRVRPRTTSVRWLSNALNFGVPIWVLFPEHNSYERLDGGFVVANSWLPTGQQVYDAQRKAAAEHNEALIAKPAAAPSLPANPTDSLPVPCNNPPSELSTDDVNLNTPVRPESPTPPTRIPTGGRWYRSWESFFREREEADKNHFETASDDEKKAWLSRERNALKFHAPGKSGARVYVWEACDSGGFFRILQDRSVVAESWELWYEEAMVFDPRRNFWDYCPFKWAPAVETGPPDDLDEGVNNNDPLILGRWYAEPGPPATLPDQNPSPLEFLYRRYGYLTCDPTSTHPVIFPFDKAQSHRILGLEPSEEKAEHLNNFITCILSGQLPDGHSDLSKNSPHDERFQQTWKNGIRNTMIVSSSVELSTQGEVFTFIDAGDSRQLVFHHPLSVLEVWRAGTAAKLESHLNYLLLNGSKFTLLYPAAGPSVPPNFNILTFPVREENWQLNPEDFGAYMSRVRTLFHERPYVAAAAFSRGGIAWRIAIEVLGIEGSFDIILDTYPDSGSSLKVEKKEYWRHELTEGEWFYLVGGYEILTGW